MYSELKQKCTALFVFKLVLEKNKKEITNDVGIEVDGCITGTRSSDF